MGHIGWEAAPAQNDMNQSATDAAVAIGEWMDRFKLRVRDRSLGHWRKIRRV